MHKFIADKRIHGPPEEFEAKISPESCFMIEKIDHTQAFWTLKRGPAP